MNHFGEHLLIDLYGVREEKLIAKDNFTGLIDKLVGICNMNKLGDTVSFEIKELEDSDRDFGGMTSIQVVKESHISIHTFSGVGFVSMDIYTCKELPDYDVIETVKKYFETDDVEVRFIKRGLRFKKSLDKFLSSK